MSTTEFDVFWNDETNEVLAVSTHHLTITSGGVRPPSHVWLAYRE